MHVKQPLHLLRVQILLMHVLAEHVRMSSQHVHCSVVHLLVHILVHNRCRRVPIVYVVLHDALLLSELSQHISVFQRHVPQANQSLFSHRGSIRCLLLCGS